ncbi:MAG: sugar phosphate isomerase/epimerase family protein, partial [Rhodothermia bacterium]
AGIRFAYHNHDFEFADLEGQVPYDLLLERTEPDFVAMEIDLYWIRAVGHEPLPYFEQYPGRFKLCHVKDMDLAGAMTEVGSGIIDFASDFGQASLAGLEHFFVEHDDPTDPLASIATSFEGLKALLNRA